MAGFGGALRFSDGSTIFIGQIMIADHDHSGPVYGNYDYWLVKTDASDNIVWEKTFGGSGDDIPYAIVENSLNEIFLIGTSDSPVSGTKTEAGFGGRDIWIIKVDQTGNQLDEAVFGTSQTEDLYANCAVAGLNNEIVIAATSGGGIEGNKTSANYGVTDIWLFKIDHNCEKIGDASFGGSGVESGATLSFDGSDKLIAASNSSSGISGNKTIDNYGPINSWFLSLDYSLQQQHQNMFGGSALDFPNAGIFSAGKFYLCIMSSSPVSGNKTCQKYSGEYDAVVLKIDTGSLTIQQQISFGGSGSSVFNQLVPLNEGFVGVGYASGASNPFKTSNSYGSSDVWLLGLNDDLQPVWNTTFGGDDIDGDNAMTVFSNPGSLEIYSDFRSSSNSGIMHCNNYGTENIFHYILSTDLGINEQKIDDLTIYPNPSTNYVFVLNMKDSSPYNIFDLSGKTVSSGIVSNEISIDHLDKGVYLLSLPMGTVRFVKE